MIHKGFSDMLQVYDYCKTTLYGKLMARLGNKDMAEEVTSEIFLRVMEHREWLLGISPERQYEYIEHTASKICSVNEAETKLFIRKGFVEERLFGEANDEYYAYENKQFLKECFSVLDEHERVVMEKKYIVKKSTAEITDELNLTEDAFFQRISRAKRKIKNRMRGDMRF